MPTAAISTHIDAIQHLPAGAVLQIPDVSWAEYEALLAELSERPAVRVMYDRGRLEVVTVTDRHEWISDFIHDVARMAAGSLGLELQSYGSWTLLDAKLKKGAEPDTCFYVQHAKQLIGKERLDLTVDPPPDVVVEVDVSHSSAPKLRFYAELGVLEVWRYDGRKIVMYRLDGRSYSVIAASVALPVVTADGLTALLDRAGREGQQAVLESFRRSLAAKS